MGLFDHLFKPKPESGGEEIVENEAEAAAPESTAPLEPANRVPAASRPDPTAFLHPKNFVPRAGSPILPAPRPALSTSTRFTERKLGPSVAPAAADEIVLTLGDILSRIPSHYLKTGQHDAKRELRFRINDLSSDIARGRAAVPLSRVAQLMPDIFVRGIEPDEDTEVRLPLQKLVEQIGLLRSRPSAPATEKTQRPPVQPSVHPMTPERAVPNAEEERIIPFVQPAETSPARETLRELRPDAERAQEIRLVGESLRESHSAVGKLVELKPAAEKPAAEHVPPPESQPSPSAVEPAKDTEAAPVKGADFFSPLPVEPAAIAPTHPQKQALAASLAPVPAVEAEKKPELPIDRPEQAIKAPEIPASLAPVSVETSSAPAVFGPAKETAPESEFRTDAEPGGTEEKIQLSLAAILRQCPREIIVGQLPPVDDSMHIALPFAPIDRQLNTGKVEVSALRFVAALPPRFQKFFTAPPTVNVPIPLEEVFQNLPTLGADLAVPTENLSSPIPAPAPLESATLTPPPAAVPKWEAEPALVAAAEAQRVSPEPAPAPDSLVPESGDSVSAEKPAADSQLSAPDGVAPVAEPVAEASSAPENDSAAAPAEEEKPELHLSAFQIFTPPPPVITPVESEVPSAETATSIEKPPDLAPAASVPEASESEAKQSETSVSSGNNFEPSALVALVNSHSPSAEAEALIEKPAHLISEARPAETSPSAAKIDSLPPAITLVKSGSSDAHATTPIEKPAALVPEALAEAAPLPETVESEAKPSETATPAGSVATDGPSAPSEHEGVIEKYDAAPADKAPMQTPAAPIPAPLVEPETKALSPSAPPEPGTSGSAGSPDEASGPKWESVAPQTDASGVFAEATKTIVPPRMIRPLIMPPPPLIGFKPAPESPAPDQESEKKQDVKVTDFELVASEVNENRKLVSGEESDTPSRSEQPDPAQSELFAEPKAGIEVASESVVSPSAEVPAPLDEKSAEIPVAEVTPLAVTTSLVEKAVEVVAAPVAEVAPPLASDSVPVQPAEPPKAEVKSAGPEHALEVGKEASTKDLPVAEPGQATAAPAVLPPFPLLPLPKIEPSRSLPAQPAEPLKSEAKSPEAEAVPEVEKEASAKEVPAADSDHAAAAAPLVPPPLPLLPLPKIETGFELSDVIPPPALPFRRLDQDALQALFMTEETLDLPKISRLAASLPGVYACVIATRDQAITGGTLPEGFDLAALLGLAPRIGEAAGRMPIGALKHFTIYGESYSISFFERRGLSLCAVHRARSFVPGVREKLVAIADELSQP